MFYANYLGVLFIFLAILVLLFDPKAVASNGVVTGTLVTFCQCLLYCDFDNECVIRLCRKYYNGPVSGLGM